MLKAETLSKTVTPAQIKFLRLLNDCGPMTVNEVADVLGKSRQYAYAVMRELWGTGIVEKTFEGIDASTQRNLSWKYKLSMPIDSIGIKTRQTSRRIPDEEILYVAILRNSKMTGQDLKTQFNVVYPNRPRGSIVNIITNARRKKLCL